MIRRTKKTIAITGTSGLIGSHLLRTLLHEPKVKKIISIDKERPKTGGRKNGAKSKKVLFVKCDLTEDDCVDIIAKTLRQNASTTLVHAALPEQPITNSEYQHELQTIGTMNILLASEMANVKKLVLTSTTDIYGAFPDNPTFIPEDFGPKGYMHGKFIKDKIDAEKQFLRFQKRFPKRSAAILRFSTILGRDVFNLKTNFLFQPTVPTILGFDPLMQFIHISDVIRAIKIAIDKKHSGIFNVAGDGVLPLSRVITMANRINLPLPEPLLKTAANALWYLNLGPAPAGHIDFLKYSVIVSTERAKKMLKFEPVYSSGEAILSMKPVEKIKEVISARVK